MDNKFEIDFFQLEKLIEASWSGTTILQFCVLQDLVNLHYYKMSEYQRKAIHSFFQTKMAFERQLYNSDTDEMREKIIARFDSNNKYYNEQFETEPYFKYNEKYWENANNFLECDDVVVTNIMGKNLLKWKH